MSAFQRPGESSQKGGLRFEKFWSKFFGVEPTKGSGSQWFAKLDISTSAVLFSLKHSSKDVLRFGSYRLKDLLKECDDAINGQGGTGGDTAGAVAIHEEETGEIYVVFRGHDFLRMAETGDIHYIVPSKGEQKRSRAKTRWYERDEPA